LAFGDNALDMIISTDSLHHWKHPEVILDEIYRCLKPGGEAWIYDGFSGASNEDINIYAPGLGGVFFSHLTAKLILSVHGFSQKEYDTAIKDKVAKTRFQKCICEKRGCMMRLRLCK
ncbi:class I SAM-dependent methyltransferase, partial [bacterium]